MATTKLNGLGFGGCNWTVAHRNRMVSEACLKKMLREGVVELDVTYGLLCWVTMPCTGMSEGDLFFEARVDVRLNLPHKIRHISFSQTLGRMLKKARTLYMYNDPVPMIERLEDGARRFRLGTLNGGALEPDRAGTLLMGSLRGALFNILEEEGVI